MPTLRSAFLSLLLPYVIYGHICMMSPPQRGALNVATPGENACYLKVGPCGEIPSAAPVTTLEGGKVFNVQFQQNLNHFYIENPGKLTADIAYVADPTEADFVELGSVNDYNAVSFCNCFFSFPLLTYLVFVLLVCQ
jgi:hypothetical protein